MKCQTLNCESNVIKIGKVYLKADRKNVQRYKCKCCNITFIDVEGLKRHKKEKLFSLRQKVQELYCIGTTLRDVAKALGVSRTTVADKLSECAISSNEKLNNSDFKFVNMPFGYKNPIIVFDELETYEHTKLKPISVGVAFDFRNNKIIMMKTASFKARGRYALLFMKDPIKLAYYERVKAERVDNRQEMILESFKIIKKYLEGCEVRPTIITDGKRAYLTAIQEVFGENGCHHQVVITKDLKSLKKQTYKGAKMVMPSAKFAFESLLGTMRAKLSRLSRATFIHTKDINWLQKTLYVYADFWNKRH